MMGEQHVSAFVLDRLALESLSPEESARVTEHLQVCERCRAEREAAAGAREHFSASVLPRTSQSVGRRVRWRKLAWRGGLVLAPGLAYAFLVVVRGGLLPSSSSHTAGEPGLGIKGGATLRVFARHEGQVFQVHDQALLSPGDQIRFVVQPAGLRYVLVASIDGSDTPSIYFPYGGTASGKAEAATAATAEQGALPGSVVLDQAPGPERVFALFSREPLSAADVAQELKVLGAGGADAIRGAHALSVPGAEAQATVVFEKRLP